MFSNLGFLIFMIRKNTFEFHFNGTLQNFLVGAACLMLQLKKHYCFYESGTEYGVGKSSNLPPFTFNG